MPRLVFWLTIMFTASALATAMAASAPVVGIASSRNLPTPLPYPYDEKADAKAQIDAAFARARQSGKRVLIDFGGNWCPDCRILAGVMTLPSVAGFVSDHFEVVTVDIGRLDHNVDVAQAHGASKIWGVPWLVIAEPDGQVVSSSPDVTDEKHTTPQAMVDWLAGQAK